MGDTLRQILEPVGLGSKAEVLEAEGIDAQLLSTLTDSDLRDLGFNMGDRKRFFAAVSGGGLAVTRPAPPERRQLTVAFIDLVGSTELAIELDPEEFRHVVSEYLKTATTTVERNGGHVAYVQGDGVMSYFGYPASREDDAEWALRAGLEVVAAVQALDVGVTGGIKARVGVATGTVVTGGIDGEFAPTTDFAVGETLNLASRLQTLAGPGEVAVSGETKDLVGGRFRFDPRGSTKLKGFDAPKQVFCVTSEVELTSRFDAQIGRGVYPMVGRAGEQQRLLELLNRAAEGAGQLALISAPPGFGKSRLVRSITESMDATGLEWQCNSHLNARALHPVTSELQRACDVARSDDPDLRRQKLSAFVTAAPGLDASDIPVLADLLEIPGAEAIAADPITRMGRIQEVLLKRIKDLAASAKPLIVTLEDAHWADLGTLDFLERLVSDLQSLPVLVIVTYRPHFEPTEAMLAAGEVFDLQPVEAGAARDLIAHVTDGFEMPSDIVRWIVARTDGVPLFVKELTKTILHAKPDLKPGMTSDVLDALEIPTNLRDSLMSRLDSMDWAKEAAQVASVIGREFTQAMLVEIARPELDVPAALNRLVEAELLVVLDAGEDLYQFQHALVQDTAYESILRTKRQQIHLLIAYAILREHPAFGKQEPETIARHCDLGGLAFEAVTHWQEAGQQALGRAANLDAVKHLSAALRRLQDLPEGAERDQIELAIQMAIMPASMATFGWGSDEVESACMRAQTLAQKLGDGATMFGSTWGLWTNYFLRGAMDPALETGHALRRMADAAGPPGMLTVAATHAVSYCHYSRGEITEGIAVAEEGMELFDMDMERQIVSMFQLSSGLSLLAIHACLCWQHGRLDEAYRARLRAIEVGEALDHLPSYVHALMLPSYFLLFQRDWDLLDETISEAIQVCDEANLFFWKPMCGIYMGLIKAARGDLAAGIAEVETGLSQVYATGSQLTLPQFQYALAELQLDAGEAREALARLDAAGPDAIARNENLMLAEWGRLRARALRALGDEAAARAALDTAWHEAQTRGIVPILKRIEADRAAFPAGMMV